MVNPIHMILAVKINNKPDIEQILSSSEEIPAGELHVLEGSEYAEKLKSFKEPVSLALVAHCESRGYPHYYHIGTAEELIIKFTGRQITPLAVNANNRLLIREQTEFRDHKDYDEYDLYIACPSLRDIRL